MNRYEIPTHLNVEDKAFAGLTMRQLLTAAVGLALAYGAASEPALPMPVGLVAAGVVLLAVALLALWRPAGRPLEDWAFVLLRFWAIPRISVWRPRERAVEVRETTPRCEVVVPEAAWSNPATGDGVTESRRPRLREGVPYAAPR
jgi:hypothetical protein